MIIEFMSITVSPAEGRRFGDALESIVGSVLVQPGCLGCRILKSWPTEKVFHLLARWENEKDLIRHVQSDIYKRLLLLMELSAAPPVLEFFSVLEIRGLDLVEAARTVRG